jgi:hypothetical protein
LAKYATPLCNPTIWANLAAHQPTAAATVVSGAWPMTPRPIPQIIFFLTNLKVHLAQIQTANHGRFMKLWNT